MLQQCFGELKKIVEVGFDDADGNGQLQGLIVMHGDVAETNHPFEFVGQTHFNQAALGKQGKNVTRAGRGRGASDEPAKGDREDSWRMSE